MEVIKVRNVNQAFPEVMYQLRAHGVRRDSRNGPVIVFPEPMTIVYQHPQERVLFWAERDANPFFHLLEAMWMLAGRDDLKFPASIVSSITNFSDDGLTLQGAYGFRWRNHWSIDQLTDIVNILQRDPNSRRAVLTMWDPLCDLGKDSKDLPCNTHIYFTINKNNELDMTVCNRSNDVVWGALGANAVHMSILQEFMAGAIGCSMGRYWQVSNNMHLYVEQHEELMHIMADKAFPSQQRTYHDPYVCDTVRTYPLLPKGNVDAFCRDNNMMLDLGPALGMENSFIRKIAGPMLQAIRTYKTLATPERFVAALSPLAAMPQDSDWCVAAINWISIRRERWEKEQKGKTEDNE